MHCISAFDATFDLALDVCSFDKLHACAITLLTCMALYHQELWCHARMFECKNFCSIFKVDYECWLHAWLHELDEFDQDHE